MDSRTRNFPFNALSALVLCVALAFAAWRVISLNLADHFAAASDPTAAATAFSLIPGHPSAGETLARQALEDDDAPRAINFLRQVLENDPLRGLSYAALGVASTKTGNTPQAAAAIDASVRFAPALVNVQLIAGGHRIADGNLKAALQHWNQALSRRQALSADLFPELLGLIERLDNRPAFAALLEQPISWWPAFVAFAATKAENLEVVMAIHELSIASKTNMLTAKTLNPILMRLQRDGFWLDARLAWMDSLPPESLSGMGNVFNGGFELPISDSNYDWVRERAGHVLVDTAPTAGASGNRALYVLFRGPRVRYQHLYQILSLPPGDFVLRGRARMDDLTTNVGLIWSVTCLGSRQQMLAATTPLKGRTPWHGFETFFSVPESNCPAQRLQLRLHGQVALDFDARGQAWFDDIEVAPRATDN